MRLLIGLLPLISRFVRGLIIFAAMLVVTYWLFFDRIGCIHRLPDEQRVLIIGRVTASRTADVARNTAAYAVADPTGQVWCVTKRGAPREKTFVIVWGKKVTTRRGRVMCHEQGRMGSF